MLVDTANFFGQFERLVAYGQGFFKPAEPRKRLGGGMPDFYEQVIFAAAVRQGFGQFNQGDNIIPARG